MSNVTSPTAGDVGSSANDSPSPSTPAATSALPTTTTSEQTTAGSPTDTPTPTTAPPPANPTTSTPPPAETTTPPPATSPDPATTPDPTTSPPPPEPTPTSPTTTPTSAPPTTSAPPPPPTTSQPPTTLRTTTPPAPTTIIITEKQSGTTPPTTRTVVTTIVTQSPPAASDSPSGSRSSSAPGSSGTAIGVNDPSGGGLNSSGKIAVGVVVPIAAVALLVLAGIYFWRKRKQRKEAEEQRRKEVEDYAYNPNADPTIPAVGGAYEMKDDSPGYRGWGSTTLASSTGRKASTTMSGGVGGPALSDTMSVTPTQYANISDTRSGDQLMEEGSSPDGEILGAMGPSAAANRTGDVHRGPSNASSSYSAAARSDESDGAGVGIAYGSGGSYPYDQYGGGANPYAEGPPYPTGQGPVEAGGTPVIRDVAARRNTRIENPSHYPQQTAGIAQNF